MFARTLLSATLLVLAAAAQAEGPIESWPQDFTSQVSRAEVRQAAIDARKAGLVPHGEVTVVAENFVPTKTRAQVLAELQEARRLGLVPMGEQLVIPTAEQNEQVRLAGLSGRSMAEATHAVTLGPRHGASAGGMVSPNAQGTGALSVAAR